MSKILVVSAHPDDEIIGMGGTLKKLSKKNSISVLFLADGVTARKKSGYENVVTYEISKKEENKMKKEIEIRKTHAKNALNSIGVNKMKFLDLPDNELDLVPFLKIVKTIESEILSFKPEIIFTHHFNDLNIDHRLAYEAVLTASRPIFNSTVKSIFSFESVSSSDWKKPYKFNPNVYVDISSQLSDKLKALSFYKNEIRKFPHPRSKKTIESTAHRWGSLSGFHAAEAFELIMSRLDNTSNLFN